MTDRPLLPPALFADAAVSDDELATTPLDDRAPIGLVLVRLGVWLACLGWCTWIWWLLWRAFS